MKIHNKSFNFRVFIIRRLSRLLLLPQNEIVAAKIKAKRIVDSTYGNTVAQGVFKGMIYEQSWWGGFDKVSKILGEYELDVCGEIDKLLVENPSLPFIDVGAADGFISVGFSLRYEHLNVHAFEISEKGQKAISRNAELNNRTENIKIYGEANYTNLRSVLDENNDRAIVLIDIEGAEFDLLTDKVLSLLSNCNIIIEWHPHLTAKKTSEIDNLLRKIDKYYSYSFIRRGPYDPNKFSCFDVLSDDERLLALSEGRAMNPKWLMLQPIVNA